MAGERRTRAEKSRAQSHRQDHLSYSFHTEHGVQMGSSVSQPATPQTTQKSPAKKPKLAITDLFSYDVALIYQDLIKTVVITSLIMLAVIGVKVGLK